MHLSRVLFALSCEHIGSVTFKTTAWEFTLWLVNMYQVEYLWTFFVYRLVQIIAVQTTDT